MYIDKKMKDTALVQTLGRLSRVASVLLPPSILVNLFPFNNCS